MTPCPKSKQSTHFSHGDYYSSQYLAHGVLLFLILHEYAASTADVFDDVNHLSEARSGTFCLRKSGDAEARSVTMLKYNEQFDNKRNGLDLQICNTIKISFPNPRKQKTLQGHRQ
jgi:hypothetical protein